MHQNNDTEWIRLFPYHEANFFHAKTLAEKLNMREEDLSITFGLASHARSSSHITLAQERYRELAEKANRYGNIIMEDCAYGQLANLVKNPESKRTWIQKAVDIWNGVKDLSAETYHTLGDNAYKQGNLSAAEEYYKLELAILEREDSTAIAPLYALLGNLAQQRGDTENARERYQKAWEKAKEIGHLPTQANISSCLGDVAMKQGNIIEALEHYHKALDIFHALQDSRGRAETLNTMGQLFTDMGMYDLAKDVLIQSVKIAEHVGDEWLMATNYNDLGDLSKKQGDFISAKIWFAKALSMSEAIGNKENAAISQRNLERVTALEAAQHQKEEST